MAPAHEIDPNIDIDGPAVDPEVVARFKARHPDVIAANEATAIVPDSSH